MDANFFLNDLDLAKMTRAHGQYIFWWHRQPLCQTLASYLFPLHCMAFTGLKKFTFNFHKWHLVHVTLMSLEETSNVFYKKDMDQTQTINSFFFLQWPWTFHKKLGSKLWHTLKSLAIFLWNRNFWCFSIREI